MIKFMFKIVDNMGNESFITVNEHGVNYRGGNGIPFALSNIADRNSVVLEELLVRNWHLQKSDGVREAHTAAMAVLAQYIYKNHTITSMTELPPVGAVKKRANYKRKGLEERAQEFQDQGWKAIPAVVLISPDRFEAATIGLDGAYWHGKLYADGPVSKRKAT